MSIFDLRDQIVGDFASYVRGFLAVRNERIREKVTQALASGALWPDPMVQVNPAFKQGASVEQLCADGLLHPDCGRIFRKGTSSFRLYVHQEEAIRRALTGRGFVLTSGTGSGKSLAYLVPIFDDLLKHGSTQKVKAIIVYPMNALINSQDKAIAELLSNIAPASPITVRRYTGQESRDEKLAVRDNPPDVLLTNFVMLEYILTRPEERHFVDRAASDLKFLVLDELHTYRGRQGADVAFLVRRLRERSGSNDLCCIGTSATLAAGGSRDERRVAIAGSAGRIFGTPFQPDDIIEETLRRSCVPSSQVSLRAAVETPPDPSATHQELLENPLVAWIENHLGLKEEDGILRRQTPTTIADAAAVLALETGLSSQPARDALQRTLIQVGTQRNETGEPVLAVKLHQFIAQGDSAYATLESGAKRLITLDGGYRAPGEAERLLYPLVFCRECGQEYYAVDWDKENRRLLPRLTANPKRLPDDPIRDGYLLLETDSERPVWEDDFERNLPEYWFRQTKSGPKLLPQHRDKVPRVVICRSDGTVLEHETEGSVRGWFIPRPLPLCLFCGVAYTGRDKHEFKKLAQLSSEGRSTSTTLLSLSAISHMPQAEFEATARKLLSFTDNRQDASLQAGHLNDFVGVARMRSAIFRALESAPSNSLDHAQIVPAVTDALDLGQSEYAKDVGTTDQTATQNRQVLECLIEYRIFEDLRRGWRVIQPNLEQCGLLRVEYRNLRDFCSDDSKWTGNATVAGCTPDQRYQAIRGFVDHLRRELALDARCLTDAGQQELKRRVVRALKEPWTLDEDEVLRGSTRYCLTLDAPASRGSSLGPRSVVGRYLRNRTTWPNLAERIPEDDYPALLTVIVETLRGALIIHKFQDRDNEYIQLRTDCLVWQRADSSTVEPDPVRSLWVETPRASEVERRVNPFFRDFYRQPTDRLRAISAGEHTGQTDKVVREQREKDFGAARLSCLYCSPTMELGIDIKELNLVHLRNIPPTPANYAQRGGRAGREKQPALVMAYCARGSGHDQYFFRRPWLMVSGAVIPPRIDLGNEELVRAHAHAFWLAETGISLHYSVLDILNTGAAAERHPLNPDIRHQANQVSTSPARLQACIDRFRTLLASCMSDISRAGWYTDEWLAGIFRNAATDFDRAFDRWRDLYDAAYQQLQESRRIQDSAYTARVARPEVERAARRETEARRQLDLLCNRTQQSDESDFYPYRYLASEGFLPGYSFPRLPVRAFVAAGQDRQAFLSRSRLLAIREYAPQNMIYHEGRKYQVTRSILPPQQTPDRFLQAKLCKVCGYVMEREHSSSDRCLNCNVMLDGQTSEFVADLFEMSSVSTWRRDRINCDEEERFRQGYNLSAHYRFAPAAEGLRRTIAVVHDERGNPVLKLTFSGAAEIWAINHGWRNAREPGFKLNTLTGDWGYKPGDEADDSESAPQDLSHMRAGVRVFVRDFRNLLLIEPDPSLVLTDQQFVSLEYALSRGVQVEFEVEERELRSDLIGQGVHRSIMLYEAAEGGAGVLERLVEDSGAMRRIALKALDACHFDALSGDDRKSADCSAACYDCLLSYTNQRDHKDLDRHLVKDVLLTLSRAVTQRSHEHRSYEEHYRWLRQMTDTRSELEREFLDHLHRHKLSLPDDAQQNLADYYARPDFYYEKARAVIFCDGSVHDTPEQRAIDDKVRADLAQLGYRVVAIRYDAKMEDVLGRYPDIFGVSR